MNVYVPASISDFTPFLLEFIEGMVHKLHVNSHKDAIRGDDIDGLLDKMAAEVQEFKDQRLKDGSDPNILSELFDTSNFAFLLYAYLRSKGVMDLKERFIKEFYDVDPDFGKIYCRKTRAGSPLRVGDEVTGTTRNGVMYIRAQHTASGAMIYLARRDIVWWWATGKWPTGKLRYKNSAALFVDGIENLLPPHDATEDRKFPFVSRYAPKGREDTQNWGKYVYQRRHKLKLIRVGYWDSEEEAAREGIKAWKAKVQGE